MKCATRALLLGGAVLVIASLLIYGVQQRKKNVDQI